jgi:manganese efflux pump family protein
MSAAAIVALAFCMSADSFAASLGKGAALHRPPFSEALRTGLIFGLVEATTPVIGWAAGMMAAVWVEAVDHWVAFIILALLGGKMAWHALWGRDHNERRPTRHSLGVLILTAIATSLDALAVGVTLAFLRVDIIVAAAAIGSATFLMATIGTLAGRWMAAMFGRGAELFGGLALIAIGTQILVKHVLAG